MKTYTIRSTAHNAAISAGPADKIIERWDKLMESFPASKFKIQDAKGVIVTIEQVGASVEEPPVVELPPVNNDDKVWPWDSENNFDAP